MVTITLWSKPKVNCLKFQGIIRDEDFSYTKLATRESMIKNSSPTCCWYISSDFKWGVSNFSSVEWPQNIVFPSNYILFPIWIYRVVFIEIVFIKFQCLSLLAFQVTVVELSTF